MPTLLVNKQYYKVMSFCCKDKNKKTIAVFQLNPHARNREHLSQTIENADFTKGYINITMYTEIIIVYRELEEEVPVFFYDKSNGIKYKIWKKEQIQMRTIRKEGMHMAEAAREVRLESYDQLYTPRQQKIAERARQMFISGYHCSEAIIRVFNEEYDLRFTKPMIKMATGLGGGMGKAKCSCGTVTTGSIILSAIYGRYDMHDDDSLAFDLARELNERFKEQFRVCCCAALTRSTNWGHPNHIAACSEYVYVAALILADIMDRCRKDLGGFPARSGRRSGKKKESSRGRIENGSGKEDKEQRSAVL